MKTLKEQTFIFASLLFLILAALVAFVFSGALTERRLAQDNAVGNRLAGHLNAAAGWQGIERGIGSTMLGSTPEHAAPFAQEFDEARRGGDSEVAQADRWADELMSRENDPVFILRYWAWRSGFDALVAARPRIEDRSISRSEWISITSENIRNEFDLRDSAFVAAAERDQVLYLNTVLRPNIATLAEFAGRERALVGNAIAASEQLSDEIMDQLKHNRALVDASTAQVLLLKENPLTPISMKRTIEGFETSFLGTFQELREEVFAASAIQWEEIRATSLDLGNRQEIFVHYMSGISAELLGLGRHTSVLALADDLARGEDDGLAERLREVEALFEAIGSIREVFDQIRYLDAVGVERVRVNFQRGSKPIPVRGEDLQDKSQRPYFILTAPMMPGEYYVSELDLNVENGEIERPFKSTIRYATPVHSDGKLAGIIVFNLPTDVDQFLHYETPETGGTESYVLANQDGFYLHHPDNSKEWGFVEQLGRAHHNVREDYAEVADRILSGKPGSALTGSGETIAYAPVFFRGESGSEDFWVILKSVKSMTYPVTARVWFNEATAAINSGLAMSELAGDLANNAMTLEKTAATNRIIISMVLFALASMLFVLLAYWSRNRILLPIQRLIQVTEKISHGDLSQRVEALGDGEFGLLGESFNTMTQERNEIQAAVEEKNSSLEKALTEIKTLRGIVPICAHCKKIRDDKGFWQQVDVYVRDHSEAQFSHSMCPGCVKEHYSEFDGPAR